MRSSTQRTLFVFITQWTHSHTLIIIHWALRSDLQTFKDANDVDRCAADPDLNHQGERALAVWLAVWGVWTRFCYYALCKSRYISTQARLSQREREGEALLTLWGYFRYILTLLLVCVCVFSVSSPLFLHPTWCDADKSVLKASLSRFDLKGMFTLPKIQSSFTHLHHYFKQVCFLFKH